jgi:hypothetical protein
MQKRLRLALVATLVASGLTISPSAQADTATFSCGAGTYTVTLGVASAGGTCTGILTLDGSVTSIASAAFQNSGLTSVTIPEGVTSIGSAAFYNSHSLTSVSLPSSLTSLTDQAFRQTGLTSVTIPSTVTYVGYLTFAIASNSLTSVTFIGGSSNLTIAHAAFQSGGFTSITLPSNLTALEYRAFEATNRLQTIRFLGNAPTVAANFNALPTPLPTVYTTANATGFTSTWKGLTVVSPPDSPTALAATAGDGSASISFTPGVSDGGGAITNYQYSVDGISYTAFSPADTSSPVSISGLTNGTTYNIRLKAVNAAGAGNASAAVSVTPAAPIVTTNNQAEREAGASRQAQEQRELLELLSIIPSIASMSTSLGALAVAASKQKCVSGKVIKFIKRGAKCPAGFVKK